MKTLRGEVLNDGPPRALVRFSGLLLFRDLPKAPSSAGFPGLGGLKLGTDLDLEATWTGMLFIFFNYTVLEIYLLLPQNRPLSS